MRVSPRICAIKGCDNRVHAASMCNTHWKRFKLYGDPLKTKRLTGAVAARWLEERQDYDGDGCLTWPFTSDRYGDTFSWAGCKTSPHRYMCELKNGPAPTPDHHAAHSCGRGKQGCVDGRHLRWATPSENMMDKKEHGTLLHGEKHPGTTLTEEQVRAIRRLRGRAKGRALAEMYGVSAPCISNIQRGKTWRHLK